jgi:hypothetical protein
MGGFVSLKQYGVLGSYFVCIHNTGATTDSEFFLKKKLDTSKYIFVEISKFPTFAPVQLQIMIFPQKF